jgi:hypothetical protein
MVFAKKISEVSKKEDKIFLLGLPSSLYTLSDRLPAKPWIDNFGWYFEIPGVQEEMLARWKNNMPKSIFWQTPQEGNWYDLGVYQPKLVTEFITKNYNKDGEVWRLK